MNEVRRSNDGLGTICDSVSFHNGMHILQFAIVEAILFYVREYTSAFRTGSSAALETLLPVNQLTLACAGVSLVSYKMSLDEEFVSYTR